MHFVPAHRQFDDTTAILPPAKWLVELVLIFNEAGREKYLDKSKIQGILALATQGVCHMTPALTKFFTRTNITSTWALPKQRRHPMRLIHVSPANITTTRLTVPTIPPRRHYPESSSGYVPNLGKIRSHRLPRIPLRIVELCGGLATGLEALLKACYAISSYAWVDKDPDAHTAASRRIAYLRLQFSHLLPLEVIQKWVSRLPMDARAISPELFRVKFPKGIDLILASSYVLAVHLSKSKREHTPPGPDIGRHILRLVLHLSETQSGGVGYIWNSFEFHPPSANTLSQLGQGTLLDPSKCGSRCLS
jgi:hypothetical protein